MKGIFGLAVLALGGIIVADLVTHPDGVQAAGSALVNILKPTYNAMLGVPS